MNIFKKIKFNKTWLKRAFIGLSCLTIAATPILFSLNSWNKTSKVMKVTQEIDKDKQIELFENIDMSDIENELAENSILDQVMKNSRSMLQRSRNQGIVDEIDIEAELLNSIEKVKNGEILIADIEDELINSNEVDAEYRAMYESAIDDLTMNANYNFNLDDTIEEPLYAENNNEEMITSRSLYYNNWIEYEILGKDLLQIKQAIIYREHLIKNINANNFFRASSIALTAVAWGVAAFYWSAWWFFGGNIPFAIAATTQAVTMTASTILSEIAHNEIKRELNNLENSFKFNGMALPSVFQILDSSLKWISQKDAIDPSFYTSLFDVSLLILDQKWLQKVVNDAITKKFSKIGTTSTKILGKLVSSQKVKKTVLISTSWASPATIVIGRLDTFFTIANAAIQTNNLLSMKWNL